jgi:hypothetical protein
MIASAIAYLLTAIFGLMGLLAFGLWLFDAKTHGEGFVGGVIFIIAAWGCAYLGGI